MSIKPPNLDILILHFILYALGKSETETKNACWRGVL